MTRFFGRAVCRAAAILQELPGQAIARWKTWKIKGRQLSFPWFSSSLSAKGPRPKVLVIVTHYADPDPEHTSTKAEKLTFCLEGALRNLGHCDLKVMINTVPGHHVRNDLSLTLADKVEWRAEPMEKPMFLGFRAVDWMLAEAGKYEYYVFLEDDIVIEDAMFLGKIAAFQMATSQPKWVLMPNRYEYFNHVKTYIDLGLHWSRLSDFQVGEYRFAENVNPHSGAFVLNGQQIALVKAATSYLRDRDCFTGPRESAATGWLLEHFRIFNPAPPNLHFLEVRHWDLRYSRAALSA